MVSIEPPYARSGGTAFLPLTQDATLHQARRLASETMPPSGEVNGRGFSRSKTRSVLLHDAGAAGRAQRGAKLAGVVATVRADLHHVHGAPSTAQIPLRKHEGLSRAEQ